jgi:MFS family permease
MNAVAISAVPSRARSHSGLWSNAPFARLFAAQSVSLFGSEITQIALPLSAAVVLGASPAEMGVLAAVGKLPYLLFGLVAGVWVDRLRYRSVLVCADFGRAVLLGAIPLAALLGALRIEHLYVVAFLAGALTVFFDVAYQSYVPELVERDQLAAANGRLEASRSIAEMAGPILGSALLQVAAAPFAIGIDALSFVLSGAFVRCIRSSAAPLESTARAGMLAEVRVGVRLVVRHPLLRPIAACSASMNLFYQMISAVYILHVTTELQLPAAYVGVIFGIGSLAAVVGAMLAAPLAHHFGTGTTLAASTALSGVAGAAIVLVHGQGTFALAGLSATQMLMMLGVPVYNINQLSLRQSITPAGLQGRVHATNRCLVWGTMPIGALAGGLLGQAIGLEPTIAIGGIGMLIGGAWIIASPVRRLSRERLAALGQIS